MSAHAKTTEDRWSQLSRSELTALGKTTVRDRLESLGCSVKVPSSLTDGRLEVSTPSGRSIEVFVSTQRLGGYAFWTQRRLPIASNRFAAVVLLADAADPSVYLVPSTECWARRLRSRTAPMSARRATPSSASRWLGRLSRSSRATRGTRRRRKTTFASPEYPNPTTGQRPAGPNPRTANGHPRFVGIVRESDQLGLGRKHLKQAATDALVQRADRRLVLVH